MKIVLFSLNKEGCLVVDWISAGGIGAVQNAHWYSNFNWSSLFTLPQLYNTRTLMVQGRHLQALPTECMSFSTACLTASLWHTASQLSVFKCSEAARAFSCFCLGTTRHMAYILLLSAYTQTFSTNCDWARTASTLPSDTYSPSCSFTKSFLRSVKV